MKNLNKAIIPVAGLGTRLFPATKAIPKELLPILDKPLIEYIVEEISLSGVKEVIFVTRSGKESIKNHFAKDLKLENNLKKIGKKNIIEAFHNPLFKNIKFKYINQEKPLGLGHAISCAQHQVKDEDFFLVILPDEYIVSERKENDITSMVKSNLKDKLGRILVEKIPKKRSKNYGIIDFCKDKKSPNKFINSIQEKPNPSDSKSNYRVVGRYILPREIMNFLSNETPSANGEIELTSSINKLLLKSPRTIIAQTSESKIFDCGSKEGFLGANIFTAMQDKILKKQINRLISPGGGIGRHKGLKIPR